MASTDETLDGVNENEAAESPKPKLSLNVKIEKPGSCKRHITITVSREDIDRYLDDAFGDLTPKAEVRGFRPGRAPRKLVEQQFKEQIKDQVKGALLLDCLQQISEDHDFSAISEPDFDIQKVEIPDEGPMTFEFDLEVRPEFDLPKWQGLKIESPRHEITTEDIDNHLKKVLERYSRLVPHDGPADTELAVVANLTFRHAGEVVATLEEQTLRVRRQLSLGDATMDDFGAVVTGASAGETRSGKIKVHSTPSAGELGGQEIDVDIEVLEVKRQELPTMTPNLLSQIGGFRDEEELRGAVQRELERRFRYHQQRAIRDQITKQLTAGADWELPDDLLKRQARRELERVVMELQSSGFSMEEIQAHANQLKENVLANTATALREHFILERIAEEKEIEPTEADYERQIAILALSRNESPRRVRARLEKRGQMDTLRNQIIESAVIDLVTNEADFTDVEFSWPDTDVTATAQTIFASDDESEIPVAHGGDSEELRQPAERG